MAIRDVYFDFQNTVTQFAGVQQSLTHNLKFHPFFRRQMTLHRATKLLRHHVLYVETCNPDTYPPAPEKFSSQRVCSRPQAIPSSSGEKFGNRATTLKMISKKSLTLRMCDIN